MKAEIEGVIACAGEGTRYAKSIGTKIPYAKHLVHVGDKTVLHRCVDSMMASIQPNAINISINPQLQDLYIAEIRQIAGSYPETTFRFMPNHFPDYAAEVSVIYGMNGSLYDLSGERVHLNNPLIAFTHGDVFLQGNLKRLQQDIQRELSQTTEYQEFAIISDTTGFGGHIYGFSRLHDFPNSRLRPFTDLNRYGIRFWNINDIFELIRAKKDLGYPLDDFEQAHELKMRRSRERF